MLYLYIYIYIRMHTWYGGGGANRTCGASYTHITIVARSL